MTTLNPVYIVDGDPSVHDWATIICEEQGLACRAFGGGGEFLSAVGEREPDCVLLDMRMPQRSGLQVQAALAKRGITIADVRDDGLRGC